MIHRRSPGKRLGTCDIGRLLAPRVTVTATRGPTMSNGAGAAGADPLTDSPHKVATATQANNPYFPIRFNTSPRHTLDTRTATTSTSAAQVSSVPTIINQCALEADGRRSR